MTSASPAPVGLIGLGAMGSVFAENLLRAGERVVLFDTREEALQSFAGREGAMPARSPADVADRAETVMVSLPTPDVVRSVVTDEQQGLIGGRAIRTFIDLSTTGVEVSGQLAGATSAAGISYLDAPVSGGVRGARAGTLAVFAAGPSEVFDRAAPLFAPFAKTVLRVGDQPGQGQIAKLLNNLLSATAVTITSEALTVGVRAGLEPEALLEAFNSGSGRNTATEQKFPNSVLTRRFDSGFRLELMLKDVRLCLQEARRERVPMILGAAVEQLWTAAAAESEPAWDHTEFVRMYERWSGVEIGESPSAERADG